MSGFNKFLFVERLRDVADVERVVLFGSRARADNGPRSDIDVAVDCPGASESTWNRILEIIDEADTLLSIDCVRFDTLPKTSPLRRAIERDGIMLYERSHRGT